MKEFIFWQNIPSIHQCSLLRSLASRDNCNVTLIVAKDVSEHRKAMGWFAPDFGDTTVIIAPSQLQVDKIITESLPDDIHIFSGLRGYPFVKRAMRKVMRKDHTIGIFSESPDPRGLKGKIRYLIYRAQVLQYKQNIDFILATGRSAIKWYQRCGCRPQQIFPFGYFIDPPPSSNNANNTNDKVHIIYIGALIHLKAVDDLIQALAGLNCNNWQLDIIGDGSEQGTLEKLAKQTGISSRTHFHGNIPNNEALAQLYTSDLLVLPSRYDGWGAVINEALMTGVPVICSNQCGAASLLDGKERGAVFQAGSIPGLKKCLADWLERGPLMPEKKQELSKWALQHISGSIAAHYLLQITKHFSNNRPRLQAPWLEERKK